MIFYYPPSTVDYHLVVDGITMPTQFTLETWIYPETASSGTMWLSFSTTTTDNCFLQTTEFLDLQTWQKIVMTWDGTTNLLYKNGIAIDVGWGATNAACIATPGILYVNQEQDAVYGVTDRALDATQSPGLYMDTLSIYNVAWSAAEVTARNSDACVDITDSTLFASWFDGATDQTGNGHTAVITATTATTGSIGICDTSEVGVNNMVACFLGVKNVFMFESISLCHVAHDSPVTETVECSDDQGMETDLPSVLGCHGCKL